MAVTPDNSEVAKLADIWLHPKQGPDAALAMAFGDVALNEFYFKQRTAALRQYLQLLVGQARIEGMALEAADTPLVQQAKPTPRWTPRCLTNSWSACSVSTPTLLRRSVPTCLLDHPLVRERVEAGILALHGRHCVVEDGEVHVFDVQRGGFVPAAHADNAGTGPYATHAQRAASDEAATQL